MKSIFITLLLIAGCASLPTDIYPLIQRGGPIVEIESMIRRVNSIHIDGKCFSACTLVLLDKYRDKVARTDDSQFIFHAVGIGNLAIQHKTRRIYENLPKPLLDELPPPEEWARYKYHVLSGKQVRSLLD